MNSNLKQKTCNCGKEAFQQSETPGNNSEFSLSNMKEFINQTSNERPKQVIILCTMCSRL